MDFKPFDQKTPVKYKRYDKSEQHQVKMPYVDVMDFGKVIIQLMDGKDPISYHQANIGDFLDPNPKFRWV